MSNDILGPLGLRTHLGSAHYGLHNPFTFAFSTADRNVINGGLFEGDAMILVVAPHAQSVIATTDKIRGRLPGPVVAADRIDVALRIIECNPIRCVVLDVRDSSRAWLQSFARRIPQTPCLVVGATPEEAASLEACLPATAKFIVGPIDETQMLEALAPVQRVEQEDSGSVVAVGLEDILSLLMMTGASASIQVSSGRNRGWLHVAKGHIIHAERDFRSGEDVAFEIASWLEPEVTSKPTDQLDVPRTLKLSIHSLLCEAARREDELQRLPALPELHSIFDDLAIASGFLGAVLTHVDNGQTILTRGTGAHVHPDLLQTCTRKHKYWPGGTASGDDSGGVVQWSAEQMTVLASVTPQIVLAAAFANSKLRTPLCDLTVNAAVLVRNIIMNRFRGDDTSIANAPLRRFG